MSVAEYVAKGATALDADKPGWANSVDIDELDMASCSSCVLGQVYGDFWDGMVALAGDGGDVQFSFVHGFDEENSEYGLLEQEWLTQIAARTRG